MDIAHVIYIHSYDNPDITLGGEGDNNGEGDNGLLASLDQLGLIISLIISLMISLIISLITLPILDNIITL